MSRDINEILATLNARGSSRASRGPSTAHNVVVADENGRLDITWFEGLDIVGDFLSQAWYVDPVNGDDTYNGGATAPLATLQEAIDRSTETATAYTIYLRPGAYGNISCTVASKITLVADPAPSQIQSGAGPAYTSYTPVTVGTFTFNNGQATNFLAAAGNIVIDTVSNAVGGSYQTLMTVDGAKILNGNSLLGGSAFQYPGTSIGALLGITKYLAVISSEIGYTPTTPANWDVTPTQIKEALDEAGSRLRNLDDHALIDTNNLSDVDDADTSLTNIGGAKTGANVGTSGVGVFSQKNALNLEFRKLNPLSAKITISNGTEPERIDFDVNVTKSDVGLGNVQNILSNFTATVDPTVLNDSSEGYSAGSWWINVAAETVWSCIDASLGAAVWEPQGAAALAQTVYAASFTQGHLFSNVLTVDHFLGERVVEVVVANNLFNKVYNLPVNYVNDDRLTINFTSVAPLTGTWYLRIYKSGGEGGGIYGEAGTGLAVYDRVSYMYTVTGDDASSGFFVIPGVTFKYKDKVAVYADGVRQINAGITGAVNPDFQVDPAIVGRINIRDAATTPPITLTGDIVAGDVLEVIFDI